MRIVELLNNISLPVTNEEAEILDQLHNQSSISKSALDPRQQHVANSLVNKDILLRMHENGRISYRKKIR